MSPVRRTKRRHEDEDDEEETPRSKRRKARDEDDDEEEEEERPRRRKSRARDEDDDEDEEEEKPRRRRKSRDDDDDDEEERPRKRRRKSRDDDDDDDDDDDEPVAKKKRSTRKGWDGYDRTKEKSSNFPDDFKLTEEPQLVRFLEDGPFSTYNQHWVDNPPGDIRKKSWICIEDDCPLCEVGDNPRLMALFNVLVLTEDGDPEVKVLTVGTIAGGILKSLNKDKKTGPLSDQYYALSKNGTKPVSYSFRPVKERDVEDDWDIEPLDDKEWKAVRKMAFDDSYIQFPTKKQLRELAKSLVDDD